MSLYRMVFCGYVLFWLALLSALGLYYHGFDSDRWSLLYFFVLADIATLVLIANVKLHQQALKLAIEANSVGVKVTLLSCLFLTPLEAVIVLPVVNLIRLYQKLPKG